MERPGLTLEAFERHDHERWMQQALALAKEAAQRGEVPVGAVLVDGISGEVLAEGYNLREGEGLATAHAELLAIQKGCRKRGHWRLSNTILYVTLEPCFMCAGAIVLARIPFVVYGATDPKAGASGSLANVLEDSRLNHRCHVQRGVLGEPCSVILKNFFQERRKKKERIICRKDT